MDESAELARLAVAEGTRTIVATPHVRPDQVNDVSELPERTRAVRERLALEGIQVAVEVGAELGHMMVARMLAEELETVALGPPGRRWLLVESPFDAVWPELHAATDELRDRGFGVVLAHPERAGGTFEDVQAGLERELASGSLLQVNSWSLSGDHGEQARVAGHWLLRSGAVTALASDAHPGWRLPALQMGVEQAVACGVPRADARPLTDVNPMRLVRRGMAVEPAVRAA